MGKSDSSELVVLLGYFLSASKVHPRRVAG